MARHECLTHEIASLTLAMTAYGLRGAGLKTLRMIEHLYFVGATLCLP